jgi:hypothetical protein
MIIAELVRNHKFVPSLTPMHPFVWRSMTHSYVLRDEWTADVNDLFTRERRYKVTQVVRGLESRHLKVESMALCLSTENSFYVDSVNQIITVHTEHGYNPLCEMYDFGFAFGFSSEELVYIDDFEFMPLLDSIPSIEQQTEIIGQAKPTAMTGTFILKNSELQNLETGRREGVLDFMLTEPIQGNDVFMYRYENNVLAPIASLFVEDFEIDQIKARIMVQDRRFR